MFSAIETNVGILCACLPSLRPLLSAMMPTYFPDSTRYTNGRTRDEEQPKHMRHPSASSRPYTAASENRANHSRNESANWPQISGPVSRSGHSRSVSASSRAYSREENELDVMQGHQATLVGTARSINGPIRQITLASGHQQHNVHPLRMSPFSPPLIPKLPRLPENIATIGPLERTVYVPPRPWRTPRTTAFHKPLPITPFPIMPGS